MENKFLGCKFTVDQNDNIDLENITIKINECIKYLSLKDYLNDNYGF
jgi:hypothetical protein